MMITNKSCKKINWKPYNEQLIDLVSSVFTGECFPSGFRTSLAPSSLGLYEKFFLVHVHANVALG